MATRKPHVLIAGGGLGGLSFAQCLRKQGVSFEIFERDQEWRTSGWCIYIHSILPELRAAFPDDVPDFGITNHLFPLDLPSQSVVYWNDRPGERRGVTSKGSLDMVRSDRVALRKLLATNIKCQLNKELVRYEESADGVTVFFKDGTTAVGDILVGADGVNSAVRTQLLNKEITPTVLPAANIGGEVTLSGSDFESQLRLGHSTYTLFGSKPAEPGQPVVGMFVALKKVLQDGRSGEYYWFMMWFDDTITEPTHWAKTAPQNELYDFAFRNSRGLDERIRRIVDLTRPEDMRRYPFPQRALILKSLPVSRVTILGDAAHVMPPTRGEAGVHALWDGINLAKCIAEIDPANDANGSETKKALAKYQEEMLRRANATVPRNIEATRPDSTAHGWGGRDVEPLESEDDLVLDKIKFVEVPSAASA